MSNLRLISGGQNKAPGGSPSQIANIKGIGMADYVWPAQDGGIYWRKRPVVLIKGGTVRDASDTVPIIEVWTFATTLPGESPEVNVLNQYALNPCYYLPDPTRPEGSFLVCCEVKTLDGNPTASNSRATLRATHESVGGLQDSLDHRGSAWGWIQGYSLIDAKGNEVTFEISNEVFEHHFGACIDAGLMIMAGDPLSLGFWSYTLGDRGFPEILEPDLPNPIIMGDQVILSRHLLSKIARDRGLRVLWDSTMLTYTDESLAESEDPLELLDRVEGAYPYRTWNPNSREFQISHIAVSVPPNADPYHQAAKVLAAIHHKGNNRAAE